MSAKLIGNCTDVFDWDYIIENIDNMGFNYNLVPTKISEWREKANFKYQDPYRSEVHRLVDTWDQAGIDFEFIRVEEYWMKKEDEIPVKFGNLVNATPLLAYISVINPGHGIPPHWDIDDNEPQQLLKGKLRRMSCFIEKPKMGHMFIVGNTHLHDQPQGSIWEWDHYKTDHIGVNFGLEPKYVFNFLGYS